MSLEPWINCTDIQQSIRFYTEVLDFEIHTAPNPDPAAFDSRHALLQRDGQALHLDSHGAGQGVAPGGFYVRVTDVDALFQCFVSNGLDTSGGDTATLRGGPISQSWGMREFWVRDPDGNTITYGHEL